MKSRSKEEHENYKDELGDIKYDGMIVGPAMASLVEQELYCSAYRPLLYEYFQIEREGKKIKGYVNSVIIYLKSKIGNLRK